MIDKERVTKNRTNLDLVGSLILPS
jgi:hypothetical protein